MKIVIDIDGYEYKRAKELVSEGLFEYNGTTAHLFKSVANGIPLPKGHGRLIDADELKRIIQGNDVLNMTGFNVRICDINATSTIIEAEREG